MKFVSIIMHSKSDYEIMKHCADTFEKFNVNYELIISSSQRSDLRTKTYVKEAEEKGAIVFIAASLSSYLAASLVGLTNKPVLSVFVKDTAIDYKDTIVSTTQMPLGMPVGTVAFGKIGAINTAYLAMQILAIDDNELAIKLKEDRIIQAKKVQTDSREIEVIL